MKEIMQPKSTPTPGLRKTYQRFANERNLNADDPTTFEIFATHIVLTTLGFDGSGNFGTGGGDDTQIDAIIVICDGLIVESATDIDEVFHRAREDQKPATVHFLLIQASSGRSFPADKASRLFNGAVSFFMEEAALPENAQIQKARALKDYVLKKQREHDENALPMCSIFLVWQGNKDDNEHMKGTVKIGIDNIKRCGYFSSLSIEYFDRHFLESFAADDLVSNRAALPLKGLLQLPNIDEIDLSFIGHLPARTVLEMVSGQSSGDDLQLDHSVFFDNVRSFLGWDNDVNRSIQATLKDKMKCSHFLLRNNGIAISAKRAEIENDVLHIHDFQIVNGCQTSSMLFYRRSDYDPDKVQVPCRIVVSSNTEAVDDIIIALNKHSPVDDFQILARNKYVARLKMHFDSIGYKDANDRICFERRAGEYAYSVETGRIKSDQVITLEDLLKAVCSAFISAPHTVQNGGLGFLKKQVKNGSLLNPRDNPELYRLAAILQFKARLYLGEKPWKEYGAKFHMIYAIRHFVEDGETRPEQAWAEPDYLKRLGNRLNSDDGNSFARTAYSLLNDVVRAVREELVRQKKPNTKLSDLSATSAMTEALDAALAKQAQNKAQ